MDILLRDSQTQAAIRLLDLGRTKQPPPPGSEATPNRSCLFEARAGTDESMMTVAHEF